MIGSVALILSSAAASAFVSEYNSTCQSDLETNGLRCQNLLALDTTRRWIPAVAGFAMGLGLVFAIMGTVATKETGVKEAHASSLWPLMPLCSGLILGLVGIAWGAARQKCPLNPWFSVGYGPFCGHLELVPSPAIAIALIGGVLSALGLIFFPPRRV